MRKGPHLQGAALSFMESDQCGRPFIYILYNVHKNREEPEKGLHFLRIRCIIIRTKDQMVKEERNEMKHQKNMLLSLIHISEPTRQAEISYAVFCLKKKKKKKRMIQNI